MNCNDYNDGWILKKIFFEKGLKNLKQIYVMCIKLDLSTFYKTLPTSTKLGSFRKRYEYPQSMMKVFQLSTLHMCIQNVEALIRYMVLV